ncbi:MAG TPA: DUF1611 domain-containing protein [Myxococcota bacterium]|nr:DUF1611 domain-containing protein [Myxococcota bacterium]
MSSPTLVPSALELIEGASRAYTTRRVPLEAMRCLSTACLPQSGDLVLARVSEIGHHKRLHLPGGGKRNLFPGDLVIVPYADRYAPNQFEARVPRDLGPCHLVAAGGIAGRVEASHQKVRRGPTTLRPLGLVASDPEAPPLNVAGWGLAPPARPVRGGIPVIAIVGTSMDSGKTTAAAYLTHGLHRHGIRVGYAKVTGTCAAGDPGLLHDAGASPVLDFTDLGYASTYRIAPRIVEALYRESIAHLEAAGVDVIVLEVADGLLQRETARLLASKTFAELTHGVLFCAAEAMGAVAGHAWLRAKGLPVLGLAGRLTTAPLQIREAREATGSTVFGLAELGDPSTARKLVAIRR